MRKKIALFANGWTTENLVDYSNGIMDKLPDNYADIYMFVSYESYGLPAEDRLSQSIIYQLPDLSDFDAAIVFYPGMNFSDSIDYIYGAIDKAGIPAINICNKREGHVNIGVDNYSGMLDLCNHLVEKHECKDIVFIAGSADNPDSNERLKALKEVLAAHNLNEPTVFYSNWESGVAIEYIQNNICNREKLPDAIVCANDSLATFAVLAVEERGFSVPNDIIVTGFDHLLNSQVFYPSIASVDQHFNELGVTTAKAIQSIFNNDSEIEDTVIPCSFCPAESCGCGEESSSDEIRRIHSHDFPYRDQYDYLFDIRMITMEQAILQANDYQALKSNLHYIFTSSVGSEGDSFCFMLDPLFANLGRDSEVFPAHSFCEEMDVIVARRDAKNCAVSKCKSRQLLPDFEDNNRNNIHIFSHIYYQNFICGYVVFSNSVNLLAHYKVYDFTNKIDRIIISLKRNMQLAELNNRLSELMEQDTLTKVKNRTAYEKYLKRLEQDFIEGENKPFAVVYFDINNLKMVNDMYGHEKGDAYIKNSCRLICNTFKHSPVFRIGGDEFVTIAVNDDFTERHQLLNEMKEHMAVLKSKGDSVPLTERISIASGMAEYDRTLDDDFSSIFKRADEIMYENKYRMKKNI